jgi:predicted nucleic acid-binding protein
VIVVADTTPLLYLSRIGRLGILHAVHAEVIVPVTVWDELVILRPDAPGVEALRAAPWIRVKDDAERAGVDAALAASLDRGEAAAITLAELLRADTLLIDERKGREVARRRGLHIQGTLGLLVVARRAGVLDSLRGILDELEREGFRVSAQLVMEALRQVGEG